MTKYFVDLGATLWQDEEEDNFSGSNERLNKNN
jgi:hypothetical protein